MLNVGGANIIKTTGDYQTLVDPLVAAKVHLKAGKIIPYSDTAISNVTTTDLQTKTATSFYVYRDTSLHADGQVLIDDGVSRDSYDNFNFTAWQLRYAQKSINFWVNYGVFNYSLPTNYTIDQLDKITILDAADLKGTDFACFMGTTMTPVAIDFTFVESLAQLTLKPKAG